MAGTQIFVAFSYKDNTFGNKLVERLQILKQQNLIKEVYPWAFTSQREIPPTIDRQLAASDIILLLLSPDFFGSDYPKATAPKIVNLATARQRYYHALVIPIILKPVNWLVTELGVRGFRDQVLPTGGKPVIEWKNPDAAYFDCIQGILKNIYKLSPDLAEITTEERNVAKAINIYPQKSARKEQLEATLRELYASIHEYEGRLYFSSVAEEKSQYSEAIQKQIAMLKDSLNEYMDMAFDDCFTVPDDIIQINARFSDNSSTQYIKEKSIRQQLESLSSDNLHLLALEMNIDMDIMFPDEDISSKRNYFLDYIKQRDRLPELEARIKQKSFAAM